MTHELLFKILVASSILGATVSSSTALPLNPQSAKKPPHEYLMEKMIGKWVMRGTVANEKVVNDVHVDRILNGQYVRIHEVSRTKDPTGKPTYEAWIHIAWDKANEEFAVMWLDNTAVTNFSADGVGHGKPVGNKIPFVWKLADGSGIRNTFVYEPSSNRWTWSVDNVDKDGKTSPFARLSLTRK